MLIIGAKGFAKQLLDVLVQLGLQDSLVFFDDHDPTVIEFLGFPVIKTIEDARLYFEQKDNRFALGVGNPALRKKLAEKFEVLGGQLATVVSPLARVASHASIGPGCTILTGAIIENGAILGKGVLVNIGAMVCHDTSVGDFVELSPGICLTGSCKVGELTFIGTGSVVIPQKQIGKKCIIGAGTVVIDHIPDECKAVGNPARILTN